MSKNTTGKTPYTKPLTVEELLAMPDKDIAYDDDNPRTTEAEWKNSFVSHSYQELRENIARHRGQQKAPTKVSTTCLLYTSPSPRDRTRSRMPSSA